MPRESDRKAFTELLLFQIAVEQHIESENAMAALLNAIVDDEAEDVEAFLLGENAQTAPSEELCYLLATLQSQRYWEGHERHIERSTALLDLCLDNYRYHEPHLFRNTLRITPVAFDALCLAIQDDPIFHNNSNNLQISVERQLAITLWRLGHFGNAACMLQASFFAGVGYGTVDRCTRQVMTALTSQRFRDATLYLPTAQEKEDAAAWIRNVLPADCEEWTLGHLGVDGSLIPLFQRPGHYGSVFFDRKCNYSLNVQVRRTHLEYLSSLAVSTFDLPAGGITYTQSKDTRLRCRTPWKSARLNRIQGDKNLSRT